MCEMMDEFEARELTNMMAKARKQKTQEEEKLEEPIEIVAK